MKIIKYFVFSTCLLGMLSCGSKTATTTTATASEDAVVSKTEMNSDADQEVAAEKQTPSIDNPDRLLTVFVSDETNSPTNIRETPKGKVVLTIPAGDDCMLSVNGVANGWWYVEGPVRIYGDGSEKTETLPNGGWIHSSVLAVASRNYGGDTFHLRESPEEGSKIIYSFSEEMLLRPVDMSADWVKVKTTDGKHEGWIEAQSLCGNPMSNCS